MSLIQLPAPPVVLRYDGRVVGRVDRSAAPRTGEIVNVDALDATWTRGAVSSVEHWYMESPAVIAGQDVPPDRPGDVHVFLDPRHDPVQDRPLLGSTRIAWLFDGDMLGWTLRMADPEAGNVVSREVGGRRHRFRVQKVERWYGDMALHGGSVPVYALLDIACHLVEIGI